MKDPVHIVARTWRSLVLHGGADRLSADDAMKAEVGHHALGAAALSGRSGMTDVTFTTFRLRGEHAMTLGTVDATIKGTVG